MYKTHAIKIQAFAQRSPDNMSLVCMMVSLSIQQNWLGVGEALKDVIDNKEDSKHLWGFKKDTYKYIMTHKHKIYGQMMAVINSHKDDKDKALSLMTIFLRIPGLGLPKAGFMCQLCAGLVGCMDIHNIRMYNLNIKDLTLAKNPKGSKGAATNLVKIVNYIDLCTDYGTENLWNSWCEYLATKSIHWVDGNHVSEVHYSYLVGYK